MPERNCATCTRQVEWGCYALKIKDAPDPELGETIEDCWYKPARIPMDIDGEEVFACPRQPIKEQAAWWNRAMMYHAAYRQGFLPDSGGVSSQNSAGLKAIQIIDNAFNQAQSELKPSSGNGS